MPVTCLSGHTTGEPRRGAVLPGILMRVLAVRGVDGAVYPALGQIVRLARGGRSLAGTTVDVRGDTQPATRLAHGLQPEDGKRVARGLWQALT
jgi:hypothetical protein